MDTIAPHILQEIERRVADGYYASANDLLQDALKALDDAEAAARRSLQRELLVGLEGEDALMTDADWDDIEQVAIRVLESRKST
jgi:Arc/MetJ-type ribon-helix-helix transcriptional regulator